jgi:hypothetical protein
MIIIIIIGVPFAGGLIALSEEGMLLGVGTDARVYARHQVVCAYICMQNMFSIDCVYVCIQNMFSI